MRSIILLCALLVPNWALLDNPDWQNFKATFRKVYKLTEEQKRAQIFEENVKKIEVHNKLYENNLTTYEKGVNEFTDWTKEELEVFLPKVFNVSLGNGYNFAVVPQNNNKLTATSVDWRTRAVVTDVKTQGACGSSWAFSATGALEGIYALKYNKTIPLSAQNLIDCSTSNYYNFGCEGGLARNAMLYVKDEGINSETDYPYEAAEGSCRYTPSKSVLTIEEVMLIRSGFETDVLYFVNQQPIATLIETTSNLLAYKKGILFDTACTNLERDLNQAVLIVGYGEENGVKYWILKNSWGEKWGENGYFRLTRGENHCGVAFFASFPHKVMASAQTVHSFSFLLLTAGLVLLKKFE